MNQKIREIVGSLISVVILILYAAVLWEIIDLVKDWNKGDPEVDIAGGKLLIVTGIGGLVSAVVIATLGISEPGRAPTGTVQVLSKDFGKTLMTIVTLVYIGVWLFLGGYAAIYGVIKLPEASSTLNELGIAWFGLLLGAGYAYFKFMKKPDTA